MGTGGKVRGWTAAGGRFKEPQGVDGDWDVETTSTLVCARPEHAELPKDPFDVAVESEQLIERFPPAATVPIAAKVGLKRPEPAEQSGLFKRCFHNAFLVERRAAKAICVA